MERGVCVSHYLADTEMTTPDKHESSYQTCVTRREFVIRGSAVGIAIMLAGCASGSGPTAPRNVNLSINVADYPSLADVGGVAYVDANGSPLAVVRLDANAFDALSRVCPHQGGTVDTSGGGFTCPVHGARFDDTGAWVGGQRTSNLTSYQTRFDSTSGVLTIG
jgi:cytochrome b6-f complex iron-sulfur subunit